MSKPKRLREQLPYRKCVGIMVINRDGKVWAGHRIMAAELEGVADYRWQMPQGGVDKGEALEPAARRELWEETGMRSVELLGETPDWLNYDLPDDKLGVALKGKYRGQTQKWFAYRFVGDDSEINIDNPPDGSHPEFDRWAWKDIDELPGLIVPFKRDIYVQLVEEFRKFAVPDDAYLNDAS